MEKVKLSERFAAISEFWSPVVAAELNGQQVKLAKFKGEFEWHSHSQEDELFLVVNGSIRIDLRDGPIDLSAGEMLVVRRGVEHRPIAQSEAEVVLFEPASTVRTGD